MRILHVLPYDLRQPGGVQTHTLALSSALNELGHESRIVAPSHPLRVRLGGTRADLALHPLDLLGLRAALRRPHDILHIQEPMLPLFGPLSLLHPGSAPTVVTLHSAEPVAGRFYRWTGPLSRFLLSRTQAVVCASEVSRTTADSAIRAGSRVIFPCLDLDLFRQVRREPEPDTILFVGRDEPRKGLTVLLDAVARLPNARLIVAGPVSDATRAKADDSTTFLGPVSHERMHQLMVAPTCAAFPSLGGEALGLTLVEAMAAGVPVVASDIDGYRIASNQGRAALLSPPGDPHLLAEHLQTLLSSEVRRNELVANGKSAADRFDARRVAEQHLGLYQSLLPA